jgi:hypothetical protein
LWGVTVSVYPSVFPPGAERKECDWGWKVEIRSLDIVVWEEELGKRWPLVSLAFAGCRRAAENFRVMMGELGDGILSLRRRPRNELLEDPKGQRNERSVLGCGSMSAIGKETRNSADADAILERKNKIRSETEKREVRRRKTICLSWSG